jgi:hypothetical protein
VLVLLVVGCGSQQSPAVPLFGPFAGYSWNGAVREMSAVMVVPQINACSGQATAATWIGAEGRIDPETQAAPFFQVGVNEQCTSPDNSYYAFWSSTAERFRPQWMFSVTPGDVIRLQMHTSGDQWVMSADDQSASMQKSVTADLTSHSPLGLASWHQEDVTDELTGNPFPYPSMGAVRFSALSIDGRPPQAQALTTIWMSTPHEILGPSRVMSDAFTIGTLHPPAAALHYQRLALQEDLATFLFNARLSSWTAATSARTIRTGMSAFARAMTQNIAKLRAYHWPTYVEPAITHLIEASERLRSRLLASDSSGFSSVRKVAALAATDAVGEAGLAVRKRLHMAITDQSLITVSGYVQAHSG